MNAPHFTAPIQSFQSLQLRVALRHQQTAVRSFAVRNAVAPSRLQFSASLMAITLGTVLGTFLASFV